MAGNKGLNAAIKAKKDEFYTRLEDIETELNHYKKHFKDKVIFCNCDDPYESNFFKYFAMNFNQLGLKKLIATCYEGSPVADTQLSLFEDNTQKKETKTGVPHKIVISEVADLNCDGAINLADVEYLLQNDKNVLTRLKGTGDFRSDECVELIKEADIVVTNPPFSLFREYVNQLITYEKKFIIVGHQNAIHYKDIFSHIKNNKIWLGYGFKGGAAHFYSIYEDIATASNHKKGMIRVSGVTWFTNLDHKKHHDCFDFYKHYSPEEYPKYDNYDAINVNKTADIPDDYDGIMGVPITFLDKYNPDEFEIIGTSTIDMAKGAPYINGKRIYERILIRKKS